MRSFCCFHFLRVLIFTSNSIASNVFLFVSDVSLYPAGTMLMLTAVIVSFVQPYKKMYMNLLNTLMLTHNYFAYINSRQTERAKD